MTVCGSTPWAVATSAIDCPLSSAALSSSSVTPIVLAAALRLAGPWGPPRPCGPWWSPGTPGGAGGASLDDDDDEDESLLDDCAVAAFVPRNAVPIAPPPRRDPVRSAAMTLFFMAPRVDHPPECQLGIGWSCAQNSFTGGSQQMHSNSRGGRGTVVAGGTQR